MGAHASVRTNHRPPPGGRGIKTSRRRPAGTFLAWARRREDVSPTPVRRLLQDATDYSIKPVFDNWCPRLVLDYIATHMRLRNIGGSGVF